MEGFRDGSRCAGTAANGMVSLDIVPLAVLLACIISGLHAPQASWANAALRSSVRPRYRSCSPREREMRVAIARTADLEARLQPMPSAPVARGDRDLARDEAGAFRTEAAAAAGEVRAAEALADRAEVDLEGERRRAGRIKAELAAEREGRRAVSRALEGRLTEASSRRPWRPRRSSVGVPCFIRGYLGVASHTRIRAQAGADTGRQARGSAPWTP